MINNVERQLWRTMLFGIQDATRQFLKIDRRYRAAIEAKVAMLKDFPFPDGFYLDVKRT